MQQEEDVIAQLLWFGLRVVAHVRFATLGDEELLPIPPDVTVLVWAVVQVLRWHEGLSCGWATRLSQGKERLIMEDILCLHETQNSWYVGIPNHLTSGMPEGVNF